MSAAPQRTVGIDVGGTKCLGVILDHDGKILAEHRRPTPRGPGSLPKLIDTLAELVDVLGPSDEVGVGVPGLVTRQGVLRSAPNLDGVAEFDVAGQLSERLGHRVHVDNDGTCAAVAEWLLGAGVGSIGHEHRLRRRDIRTGGRSGETTAGGLTWRRQPSW